MATDDQTASRVSGSTEGVEGVDVAILLKKHEVISIPAALRNDMRVHSGCIWLTRSRDRQDYILRRTEKVVLDKGETAIVEALKDSCITIKSVHNQ